MKAEELGTGILGKPAQAIVMKNGGRIQRKEFPVDEDLTVPVEHVDLGAILEKEGSSPELDEVLQNIEELKPEHLTVSSREFDKLKKVLLHGFTATQLASYIRRYELLNNHEIDGSLVDLPTAAQPQYEDVYPWIVSRSQWLPEVRKGEEAIEAGLRGYLLEAMTPKEKLVVRLMRQYWELSILEIMAGEGYLDVQIREPEFSLLTLGTQQWLREIARRLLGPGRQIEIIPSEAAIRIVAPKAIAETVLAEINGTLQNVQSRIVDIRSISSSPLDPTLLTEVARLTNSVITRLESRENIRITWVDSDDRRPELENLGDRVFRLLLTSHQHQSVANKLLVHPAQHESARLVAEYGGKEKLTWSDRLHTWARWTAASPAKGAATPSKKNASQSEDAVTSSVMSSDDFTRQLAEALDKDQDVSHLKGAQSSSPIAPLLNMQVDHPLPGDEPAPISRGWSPETTKTTAVFGHLLHQQPGGSKQIILKAPINQGAHRILSPALPPLFKLELPGKIRPTYLDSTILMRFLPVLKQDAGNPSQQPPSLELAINVREPRIEEGYISGISHLRAIKSSQITDVSLPDQPVDFRLTQSLTAELLGDAMFNAPGLASLQAFLTKSRLEPQNGKLETPARLSGVALPRRLFSPAQDQAAEQEGVNTSADELVEADYIFAGLEVRRALETTLDGWKLVYTSIEAGQGGGQRAELSLEATPGWDWDLARKAGDVSGDAFLDSAYKMAEGKLLSWAESE